MPADPFAAYATKSDPFAAYASAAEPAATPEAPKPRGMAGHVLGSDHGPDLLLDNLRAIGGFIRSTGRKVAEHPVETGALVGAGLAAPLTGGGSLPVASWAVPLLAAGLGGAGGAGVGMTYQAAAGNPDGLPTTAGGVIKEMAKQGAIQGVTEGGGAIAQKGLQMAGRGLYRTAARFPAKLTEKYGDLIGAGLKEGLPVGKSGVAQARMTASKGATDELVNQATAAGRSVPVSNVTGRYSDLVDVAAKRERLGVPGDINEIAAREQTINAANPSRQMTPSDALGLKREADNLASAAQNQVKRGAPVNDMTAQLHDATRAGLNDGLETATAGMTSREGLPYRQQNARTSTLYGLSRGLRTAESRPHALTNLASVGTGIASGAGVGATTGDSEGGAMSGAGSALIMRALLSPGLQSRAGIGAYAAGAVPAAQLIRAALLARMTQGPDASDER